MLGSRISKEFLRSQFGPHMLFYIEQSTDPSSILVLVACRQGNVLVAPYVKLYHYRRNTYNTDVTRNTYLRTYVRPRKRKGIYQLILQSSFIPKLETYNLSILLHKNNQCTVTWKVDANDTVYLYKIHLEMVVSIMYPLGKAIGANIYGSPKSSKVSPVPKNEIIHYYMDIPQTKLLRQVVQHV